MHRALGSCTVWHLALKDIQTLAHVYPEMLQAMVEAFTGRWEHHLNAMGPDKRQAFHFCLSLLPICLSVLASCLLFAAHCLLWHA